MSNLSDFTGSPPKWEEITNKPAEATRWPTFTEVTSKPATYPPDTHTHDDRYYTEAEVDTLFVNNTFLFDNSLFGGI